jgi:hypothetical protein
VTEKPDSYTTDNALRWDLYSDEEIEARISQLDRAITDTDRYLNNLRRELIDLMLLLTSGRCADESDQPEMTEKSKWISWR